MATRVAASHPLLQKTLQPIATTAMWMERWAAAKTVEELTGLLEFGLTIPTDDQSAMVEFYFTIADGYLDTRYFTTDEEPDQWRAKACQ